MIRIRTPSRLHLGLLALPSAHAEKPTLPRRDFGGVGLMIDRPGIALTVAPAQRWAAEGPVAARALEFAQSYAAAVGITDAFHLHVESAAPEHAGLGTGTQLGLAVARAIAELTAQPARDAVSLAQRIGRGARSAIGIHGFERGGFLTEGGKGNSDAISPLLARLEFPAAWHIVLVTPRHLMGTHGGLEIEAFGKLAHDAPNESTTDALCRLVLLGMMPTFIERDLDAFGEAVHEFNRRAGEMFRAVQGGVYAHPRIDELIRALRAAGIRGVGQSSWGPTVFAIMDANQTTEVCARLTREHGVAAGEIIVTAASAGAILSK